MVKGPAALVVVPALLAWAVLDRRHLLVAARGTVLAAALAAPWHLWQLGAHGWEFGRVYLGLNVVARISTVVEGNTGPWWYYLEYAFFHWVNPWHWAGAVALLPATAAAVRGPRRSPGMVLVVAWLWTTLVFFSAIPTKLHWYVMPVYPALAVVTACRLAGAAETRHWLRRAIGAACAVTLALAGADVALRRLGNRPAEDTRAVLLALPPAAVAPVLLVADDVPLGAARFYAGREVRRPAAAEEPPAGAWLLAVPATAPQATGLRVRAVRGTRVLLGPR
jgi:4-amino-4-deoxy-L-arabinose transferase-like glycosyltransferase